MKSIIFILYFSMILAETNIPSLDFQQSVKLGSYKVTYINDLGTLVPPKVLYPESTTSFWEKHKDLLDENGNILLAFGGFLIETTNQKILMDLGLGPEKIYLKGIGNCSGGTFLKNLEKAGVKPEEITDVFFTHLHQDNVGWATIKKNDKYVLTFPKAKYWCSKEEWEHFSETIKSEKMEINEDLIKRVYEPLKEIIKIAEERQEIAPGLFPILAEGHTPGLTVLKLEAERKRIWFTSDIFHSVAEFDDIFLYTGLDNSGFAKETRMIILPEFCRPHVLVANARFGKYVFGKLNDNYRVLSWVPCKTKECHLNLNTRKLEFIEDL